MEADSVFDLLAANLRAIFEKNLISQQRLEEIRLRVNAPLFVRCDGTEYAVKPDGTFSGDTCLAYCVTKEDIDAIAECLYLVASDFEKNKETVKAKVKQLTDQYPLYE